jgi:hypothetical protein
MFEGYFVDFSGLGTFLELFFKTRGLTAKLLDRGLIAQKSRDLFARSPNLTEIMNYFYIGNLVDWVHGWWTTAEA